MRGERKREREGERESEGESARSLPHTRVCKCVRERFCLSSSALPLANRDRRVIVEK